jgi:hypothetical protein
MKINTNVLTVAISIPYSLRIFPEKARETRRTDWMRCCFVRL